MHEACADLGEEMRARPAFTETDFVYRGLVSGEDAATSNLSRCQPDHATQNVLEKKANARQTSRKNEGEKASTAGDSDSHREPR